MVLCGRPGSLLAGRRASPPAGAQRSLWSPCFGAARDRQTAETRTYSVLGALRDLVPVDSSAAQDRPASPRRRISSRPAPAAAPRASAAPGSAPGTASRSRRPRRLVQASDRVGHDRAGEPVGEVQRRRSGWPGDRAARRRRRPRRAELCRRSEANPSRTVTRFAEGEQGRGRRAQRPVVLAAMSTCQPRGAAAACNRSISPLSGRSTRTANDRGMLWDPEPVAGFDGIDDRGPARWLRSVRGGSGPLDLDAGRSAGCGRWSPGPASR